MMAVTDHDTLLRSAGHTPAPPDPTIGDALASDMSALDAIFGVTGLDGSAPSGHAVGQDGFAAFLTKIKGAFPDLKVSVERLVKSDTDIAVAYTIQGTHQGEFAGLAPTGKTITARGVQVARFEDGQLIERWGVTDEDGLLEKLGTV